MPYLREIVDEKIIDYKIPDYGQIRRDKVQEVVYEYKEALNRDLTPTELSMIISGYDSGLRVGTNEIKKIIECIRNKE